MQRGRAPGDDGGQANKRFRRGDVITTGVTGVNPGQAANRGAADDGMALEQTGNTYKTRADFRKFPMFNSVSQYEVLYESYRQQKLKHLDHKCFDFVVKNSDTYLAAPIGPISMTTLLTTGDGRYNQYTGASISPTSLSLRLLARLRTNASNVAPATYLTRVFQWRSTSAPPTAVNTLTGDDQGLGSPLYIRSPVMTYRNEMHYLAQFKGALVSYCPTTQTVPGGAQIYQAKYVKGKHMLPIIASPVTASTLVEGNIYYITISSGATGPGTSDVDIELHARGSFTDGLLARGGGA